MAMTGGKAYLLKTSTTSIGSTVNLYAYVVESINATTRKYTLKLGMYVVPSGGGIGSWGSYGTSYLGTQDDTFSGGIPYVSNGTEYWIVENIELTGSYSDAGAATATIYWSWGVNSSWGGMQNPSGSFKHTLTSIAKKTYAVKYSANGGSGAPSAQTKTYGTNLTLSTTQPTRSGYLFKCWNTKSDGSGTNYSSGATYSANAALTLYAVWVHALTVVYHGNGADSIKFKGSEIDESELPTSTYGYGMYYSDGLANGNNSSWIYVTKSDHTWTGYWNTKADGTGNRINWNTAYYGEDLAEAINSSYDLSTTSYTVDLYLEWQSTKSEYTISFDSNGGDEEGGEIPSQTKEHGVDLVLTTDTPIKEGSTFLGWAVDSSATVAQYQPGGLFNIDSDTILYAVWSLEIYTVTFDLNGGTYTGGGALVQTVTRGNDATPPNDPTMDGKTFKGWAGSYKNIQSNITIRAMWDTSPVWIFDGTNWVRFI